MDTIYEIINPIALRVALSPIILYESVIDKINSLEEPTIDNETKESILIASMDLYEALSKNNKDKKYQNMRRSVLKYQIRRMCRCTPYGAFSGIGLSQLSENTSIVLDSSSITKRARIDMKWLLSFIQQVTQDDTVLFNLRVKCNQTCYVNGDRYINPYFSEHGNAKEHKNTSFSIRLTKAVKVVIDSSHNFISLCDLSKRLQELFRISNEITIKFLHELIDHEFLILEIFPPLINSEPLNHVIDILVKSINQNKYTDYLNEIKKKLAIYNALPLGDGIDQYFDIINTMSTQVNVKDYLQIDTKLSFTGAGLSINVGKEVERLVNMLIRLAPENPERDYLSKYKNEFINKYGYNTEVQIMEMLDYNIGIGVPANYKNSKKEYIYSQSTNSKLDKLNHILLNKAINSNTNPKKSIVIEDQEIDDICANSSAPDSRMLNSFDLFAQLLASSPEAIDNGDFSLILSGCISSSGGMNSIGRFSDLFWDETHYDKEILLKEQLLLGDSYVIAEMSEQFQTGRTANVDMNNTSSNYQIAINCNTCLTKTNIDLTDIYIGIDQETNQFYAKSANLNKRIHARTTHMLNSLIGSHAYRFLRDISSIGTKQQIGEIISSVSKNNFDYFPRIVYGKTILQPAKWCIKCDRQKNQSFEEWDILFLKHVSRLNIPTYVNYMKGDNFLRLNIEKKVCRELIFYDKSNKEDIYLTEEFADVKHLWLSDSIGNKHCCELVFTLAKKNNISNTALPSPLNYKSSYTLKQNRNMFPGEDGWIYCRLYGMLNREDEFIGIDLNELVKRLNELGLIKNHFFIRYFDAKKHIRLRIQVKKNKGKQFYNHFHNFITEKRNKGIITDMNIAVYEREIERYGGSSLIDIAEKVFSADSILVEKIMEAEYSNKVTLPKEYIAIWSIFGLLQSFDKDLSEADKWLSSQITPNEYRTIFKHDEKNYRNSLSLQEVDLTKDIIQAYANRNLIVRKYHSEILLAKTNGVLTNSEDNILSSLIHMFCNRYVFDNYWEKKVRALTRHSIYSSLSYIKHQQNK